MKETRGAVPETELETAILDALMCACCQRDLEAAQRIFTAWGHLNITQSRPY
jgi:hypothetical protein